MTRKDNNPELSSVMREQYKLLMTACRQIGPPERKKIREAFKDVFSTFKERYRENGEYYFIHSVSVARIIAEEMDLDTTSIISALLLDIPKSQDFDKVKFENKYGKRIADMVLNLNTLSGLRMQKVSINSENFIQLLLTMSIDIRVILIRLADRLNLMRIIHLLPHAAQTQVSLETSGLYAPLAHRLGLYRVKTELEELAMKYAFPEIYLSITRKIEETKEEQNEYFTQFMTPIQKELSSHELDFEIKYRTKSIPSIWNKMKKQNIDFDQVYDFFAIRIILNSPLKSEKADIWRAYSLVTNVYQPNPSRMRDWISAPKRNGYESLHTTVIGPKEKWIEVQIRSVRMDEAAEKGSAAHWKYKVSSATSEENADNWLANVRSMLENAVPGEEDMGSTSRMELFSDYVYAFTPQGDLKKLKAGATVLDFAFEIHTDIGEKCSGAKVNNLYVPLKQVLKTGDQVEIITTKNQKPNKDWLNFVTTSKAITKIKRCLKELEFSQADTGKGIFLRKLSQLKIAFTDELANKLVNHFKAESILDFYHGIAEGKYELSKIREVLQPSHRQDEEKLAEKPFTKTDAIISRKGIVKAMVVINDNTPLDDVKLAKCCQPVYGDKIFGFITVAEGIKIHRIDCTNAHQMHLRYAYRTVTARWAEKDEISAYIASIKIVGDDQVGMLNLISETITRELNANIRSINLSSSHGKFEGTISVNVLGRSHLDLIIARLSKLKGVKRVQRLQ
jgi:GTP diphosphokinase / guanosine-3',5'-bis(diphosphate) 3'-diphosphatase